MKKINFVKLSLIILLMWGIVSFCGCIIPSSNTEEVDPNPSVSEFVPIEMPLPEQWQGKDLNEIKKLSDSYIESQASTRYGGGNNYSTNTHGRMIYYAALYWGLDNSRASDMYWAANEPDNFDNEDNNSYCQQWSHAWLRTSNGNWIWGDADDDFHDNVDGDSGEWNSPESYAGKWAGYYYDDGNQSKGDWYIGYAGHYLQDATLVLHNSDPKINMISETDGENNHYRYEEWVYKNLSSGHNFAQDMWDDPYYYSITNLKQAIYNTTWWNSYWTSTRGKKLWDSYADGGFLTESGDYNANSDVVKYTKEQLICAVRLSRGLIKYALDKYNQW